MDVGIWRTSYSCPVSLVREVPGETEKLETEIHYLLNSSWASCASLDRILVRMNENIKRLVLHFCFINLLHRILILLLVFGEKLSYKFSSLLKLLLLGKQFIN